jgi:hypothetical protein
VLGKHKDLLSIPFSLNVAPDSTVNKSLLFGKAPESTVNKPAHISSEVQQSQPPPLFGKARGATVNKKRAARKTTSSAPVVASGLAALKSAASGDAPTALFSAKSSASFENTNFQPPVGGQFAFPNLFNQNLPLSTLAPSRPMTSNPFAPSSFSNKSMPAASSSSTLVDPALIESTQRTFPKQTPTTLELGAATLGKPSILKKHTDDPTEKPSLLNTGNEALASHKLRLPPASMSHL